MNQVRAKYCLGVPMFLGDARQRASELRPPAVKMALRWWWRALNWHRFRSRFSEIQAVVELHRREGELFGSAAQDGAGGQGRLIPTVQAQGIVVEDEESISQRIGNHPGLAYLLGPGLWNGRTKQTTRSALVDGSFTVTVAFRRDSSDEKDISEVSEALWLLGTLGGIGARSRRGWGSVSLIALEGGTLSAPQGAEHLREQLSSILAKVGGIGCPPFTAFSHLSRIDLSCNADNPLDALRAVGRTMLNYRNHFSKSNDFQGDHDLMYAMVRNEDVEAGPRRAVFGLPNNAYLTFGGKRRGKKQGARSISVLPAGYKDDANKEITHSRRASPLLIHVHRFPGGGACAIQSLLPAQFIVPGEELKLGVAKLKLEPEELAAVRFEKGESATSRTESVPFIPDWGVVTEYLDRFDCPTRLYG